MAAADPKPPPPSRTLAEPHQLEHLGDFTVDRRLIPITLLAVPVGAVGAGLAFVLLRLIGLITNLVFYARVDTRLVAPSGAHASTAVLLLAPIGGGLIVGLMARYGSEKIRGHGMPEAIEAILVGGSQVQPRVAVLKPLSAAISIGTGGPFGAEGPIIMTGGAAGSILAQLLHMSADERKTLLVAGAAAGMAATFNAPFASVLLAIELLLFEWRPRSFVPVAAAVAVATVLRGYMLGDHAIFAASMAHAHLGGGIELLCVPAGLVGGLLAVAATRLVYAAEDGFRRLPIHWMWWPAIGGVIIGVGGLIEPQALGVGYDVIDKLLTGHAGMSLVIGILVVKTAIWSLSLGSGTSGGVLAPVFMIGAALGALEAHVLPGVAPGFWALVGLAAVVGGVMRSPLTGTIFPLELTHAWNVLLPVMIAAAAAYALSTLILRRSVLTEKVARRGLHLTREYSVDPLELILVRDVITDAGDGQPLGMEFTVFADDTLREAANRFAAQDSDTATVIDRASNLAVGRIAVRDLLEGRLRNVHDARHRERILLPAASRPPVDEPQQPEPLEADGIAGDDEPEDTPVGCG